MAETKWETDKWFVSHLNYNEEVVAGLDLPEKIRIHDVTLRDGEQQAGLAFQKDEKIEIGRKLAEAGVHRIEAGMPAVHRKDAEAIKELAEMDLGGTQVFTFSRCMVDDIDRAADLGVDGVVVEIPAGEKILERCYGWSLDKAKGMSIEATAHAKERGLYTVFFPIDATRADLAWFLDLIDDVSTQGHMDSLAIIDTFGVCSPHAIDYMVRKVKQRIDKPLEVHFHDDFGMGVANTIIGLAAGAEVAHVTVSAIGERAGNAALEDVVLTLKTMYDRDCGVKTEMLYELSQLVRKVGNIPLRPNRPIVGDDTFRSESGIVAAWYLRCKDTFPCTLYPFRWDLVGRTEAELVYGKWCGRPTIELGLRKMGAAATDEQIMDIVMQVKDKGYDLKRRLTEAEFEEIAQAVIEGA
jgi:isopropylmalate/homocitrate/citramalate synthase